MLEKISAGGSVGTAVGGGRVVAESFQWVDCGGHIVAVVKETASKARR